MNSFHYVYRQGGNPPTIKHPTFESADKEAKRLAEQHNGMAFEILKCVAITQVTGPAVTELTTEKTPIPQTVGEWFKPRNDKPKIEELKEQEAIPLAVLAWLKDHKVDIDKLPFA